MQISERVYLVGSEQFGLSHPLDCNCYLIDGGSELALIDTGLGMGVEQIIANIGDEGFDPQRLAHVLITHAHPGHCGGSAALRERTGAKVWATALGVDAITNLPEDRGVRLNFQFGRYPTDFQPRSCVPDGTIDDGDRITVGEVELSAILVQGHTKDSTCFVLDDGGKRTLFTGDVVFYAGKLGLLNLEGFSFDDYRRDILKLADLNVDTLLPGHGVFVVRGGQKHINRAIFKLSDFVMPETFFEVNEFVWTKDYLRVMTE
jgi:hydroxyacylglutathione hydrolase